MRIWAKEWQNSHLLRDLTIEDTSDETRTHKVFHAIDEICEKFDNKFMIIPSSVHELIIIPSEGVDPYNILEMISEVNGSEVRSEEVLSNDLYMYDREKKTIIKF